MPPNSCLAFIIVGLTVILCTVDAGDRSNKLLTNEIGTMPSSESERGCRQLLTINQKHCFLPSTFTAIKEGMLLAIKECQYQFRYERWNCSTVGNGRDRLTNIFKKATKEAAFVHAIDAAAISYKVTQACSRGRLLECSCARNLLKNDQDEKGSFCWNGCSDDVAYGENFTKMILDADDSHKGDATNQLVKHNKITGLLAQNSSDEKTITGLDVKKDQQTLVDVVVEQPGVVKNSTRKRCRCHGPTGSCVTRSCWKELKNFRETGIVLKRIYNFHSTRVTQKEGGSKGKPEHKRCCGKQGKGQLVYLDRSPSYCSRKPNKGYLGVAGRQCNSTSSGRDGCNSLCCGWGYDTKQVKQVKSCNCRFIWCCDIVCEQCSEIVDVSTCKSKKRKTKRKKVKLNKKGLKKNCRKQFKKRKKCKRNSITTTTTNSHGVT